MNIAEAIRIALQSLWANKLRSVLTLLGVVIGVAAVIAVVTFISGINDYVAKKIFNLGADVFIISKMSPVETNVDHFLEAEKPSCRCSTAGKSRSRGSSGTFSGASPLITVPSVRFCLPHWLT